MCYSSPLTAGKSVELRPVRAINTRREQDVTPADYYFDSAPQSARLFKPCGYSLYPQAEACRDG